MNENKIFEKTAKTNKTTPENVKTKIRSFFEDLMKRNNPRMNEPTKINPHKRDRPTPEKRLEFLMQFIKKRK